MITLKQKNSHWYRHNADGTTTPVYEMPNKSKPGTTRPTTLRDARELKLLPSVTNVLGVLDKPQLDDWRVRQAILSALTLPQQPGEPLEAFAQRVVEDMDAEGQVARDFGTQIHDAAEAFVCEGREPEDPRIFAHLENFMRWVRENLSAFHLTESYLSDPMAGVAGRLDLVATLRNNGVAVIDFKTQKMKKNKDGKSVPAFYDEWGLQLAAYAKLWQPRMDIEDDPWPTLMSVVIDSTEPGPVHIKEWGDPPKLWRIFQHALELWKFQKGYDPTEGL